MKLEDLGFNGLVEVVHKITNETVMIVNGLNVKYNDEILTVKKGSVKRTFDRLNYRVLTRGCGNNDHDLAEKENGTMNENANVVTNEENTNVVTNETAQVEIPNTIDDTVNLVFDEKAISAIATADKKMYETVKFENKEATLLSETRDMFVDAYNKALKLAGNAEWAQRKIIAKTMNSDIYKQSFINDADYAHQIGVSKSYLSKAKTAVEILDWLSDNGYGNNWRATAIEELIGTYNDLKKKSISFHQFMKFSELKEGSTVAETRKAIKTYKDAMTPKETPVTTTSVPRAVVTTTSVPNADINTFTDKERDKCLQDEIKNFSIETATPKQMNISVSFGDITLDVWLDSETCNKTMKAITKLIKGKLQVEFNSLKNN